MLIDLLKRRPKAFSVCCFVASATAYFFGKVRFILGEAAPALPWWAIGKKNPNAIVNTKNIKILSEDNKYWGLSEMDDGNSFFCWLAAIFFLLGIIGACRALMKTTQADEKR